MKAAIPAMYVLMILLIISCYKDERYSIENTDASTFFQISIQADSMPANGASPVNILISGLPLDMSDSLNNIQLSTTKGRFAEGTNVKIKSTVIVEANKEVRLAKALLYAPLDTGIAVVSATMRGITKTDTIRFTFNVPARAEIIADKIFITPSYQNGNSFSVQLKSQKGKPSLENQVNFSISRETGEASGYFQKYISTADSNGIAYFNYFVIDTTLKGKTLKVRAHSIQNPAARDSLEIFIY